MPRMRREHARKERSHRRRQRSKVAFVHIVGGGGRGSGVGGEDGRNGEWCSGGYDVRQNRPDNRSDMGDIGGQGGDEMTFGVGFGFAALGDGHCDNEGDGGEEGSVVGETHGWWFGVVVVRSKFG